MKSTLFGFLAASLVVSSFLSAGNAMAEDGIQQALPDAQVKSELNVQTQLTQPSAEQGASVSQAETKDSHMEMHTQTNAAEGVKDGDVMHEQSSVKTTTTSSETKSAEKKAQKGPQDTSQSVKKLFQSFHAENNTAGKVDTKDTSLNTSNSIKKE